MTNGTSLAPQTHMHEGPRCALWPLWTLWTLWTSMAMIILLANCGGASTMPAAPSTPSGTSPAPSVPPPLIATVTITATGVSPKNVEVAVGGRVTFVNSDVRVHDIYSNPHNTHTDCPAVNAAAFLTPGQSRDTDILSVVGECGFHDHIDPNSEPMQGRIIIK